MVMQTIPPGPGYDVRMVPTHTCINQYRTRAQTNAAGLLSWTFPTPYPDGVIPVVQVAVEDASAGANWGHQITSVSNTGMTVQLSKTTAVLVLGISVLGIAANPQAYVHLTAIPPQA